MRNLKTIIMAGILVFAAQGTWASTSTLEGLIHDIQSSTDDIQVQVLGQTLSGFEPETTQHVKLLIDALSNQIIAPHIQAAIVNIKDPALAPALHDGLKAIKASLPRLTEGQADAMTPEQKRFGAIQALSLASIVHALGALKYTPAAPDLRELLSYNEEFQGYISYAASQALGKMDDEQAYQMMMADLEKRKAVTPSGYGVRAIRKIVTKIEGINATYATKPKIVNDPRSAEINELSQKLKGMGKKDPDVREVLTQLLKHPLWQVRNGASYALVRSLRSTDKDAVREMLRNEDNLVRMRGVSCLRLARTWDTSFLPIIVDMIQNDTDPGVRRTGVNELLYLCSAGVRRRDLAEAVPYLKKLLQHPSLNYSAFRALRCLTGRYFPHEGMDDFQKRQIELGPDYLPEDTSRTFDASP